MLESMRVNPPITQKNPCVCVHPWCLFDSAIRIQIKYPHLYVSATCLTANLHGPCKRKLRCDNVSARTSFGHAAGSPVSIKQGTLGRTAIVITPDMIKAKRRSVKVFIPADNMCSMVY